MYVIKVNSFDKVFINSCRFFCSGAPIADLIADVEGDFIQLMRKG